MTNTLTLLELVERIASDLWTDRQRAIDVRDRKVEPSPEWRSRLAADVEAHIGRLMAETMRYYDVDDLTAVGASPLRIHTGAGLLAWMEETPDYPQKIAELRRQHRDEYERKARAEFCESAVLRVLGDRVRELDEEITKAVRKVVTAPDAVVSAASMEGEPRKIRRVDLLVAAFGIKANRLTIGGVVFERVQVELPAKTEEQSAKKISERDLAALSALAPKVKSWATELHRKGIEISLALVKKEFPNLVERAARKVLNDNVQKDWRAQRGTPQSKRRTK